MGSAPGEARLTLAGKEALVCVQLNKAQSRDRVQRALALRAAWKLSHPLPTFKEMSSCFGRFLFLSTNSRLVQLVLSQKHAFILKNDT